MGKRLIYAFFCTSLILTLLSLGYVSYAQEGAEEGWTPPEMIPEHGGGPKVPPPPPRLEPTQVESLLKGEVIPQAIYGPVVDDEIAFVRGNILQVWDPLPADPECLYESGKYSHCPSNFSYTLPSGVSWRDVATGDLNGDGDDEIIALDNTDIIHIFNPGGPPLNFSSTTYYVGSAMRVASGNMDSDPSDEIIVITFPKAPNYNYSTLLVYDPAGILTWALIKSINFLGNGKFYYVDAGRIFGDNTTEYIAMAEYFTDTQKCWFYIYDPTTNSIRYYRQANGRHVGLVTGDYNMNGLAEVILARDYIESPSMREFYYDGVSPIANIGILGVYAPNWGYVHSVDNPGWTNIDAGDATGNGDDELVALRKCADSACGNTTFMIKDVHTQIGEQKIDEDYVFSPPTAWDGVKMGNFDGDSLGTEEPVFFKDNWLAAYDWYLGENLTKWPWASHGYDSDISVIAAGNFERPYLDISLETVNFLTEADGDPLAPPYWTVEVNIPSGLFTYTVSTSHSWLSTNPAPGSPGVEPYIPLKVSVDTNDSGFPCCSPAPCNCTGYVTVTSSSDVAPATKIITVNVHVVNKVIQNYLPIIMKGYSGQ